MKRKLFYQFSAPSNLTMIVLMIIPLVYALYLSLHFVTFRNITSPDYTGFANYGHILSDPQFWMAVRFSLVIILVTVPIQISLGFVMALLLDQVSMKARGILMSMMLLPFVVVPVVGTVMFRQLFEVGGIMSHLYRQIFEQPFVFSPTSVKLLIVAHLIWYVTPYPLVVFFAGLQTLPQEHLEATTVDGASRLQQIRYIVIPHLKPLLLMIVMILIMDMYRMFDSILVMTKQNPMFQAENLMMYNYRIGMSVQRLGRANATAVLTIIGVLVVLIPFLRMQYRSKTGKE
jgi:ABC-type sugar transport system permease subunit